jgi:ribonuclease HI
MTPDPAERGGLPESEAPPPLPRKVPDHLFLYIDGASAGNPGPAGAAAVLKDEEGTTLLEKARAFGPATSNVAEYQALLLGLELAAQLRPRLLTIRSDSELLVRQLAGQYRVKAAKLKGLYNQARRMLAPLEGVEIESIPRTQNAEADRLAAKACQKAKEVQAVLPPQSRGAGPGKVFRLK